MFFFKRKQRATTDQIGRLIFSIISGSAHSKEYRRFLENVGETAEKLPEHHAVEILVGHLFGAQLAVEDVCKSNVSNPIMEACLDALSNHLNKTGLLPDLPTIVTREGIFTLKELVHTRFEQYAACIQNTAGAGPSFHLGKQFYWNVIGREEPNADRVVVASIHLFATVDAVKHILGKVHIV